MTPGNTYIWTHIPFGFFKEILKEYCTPPLRLPSHFFDLLILMDFKDRGKSDAEGPVVLMSCDPQVQHPVVPELWKGARRDTGRNFFEGDLIPQL